MSDVKKRLMFSSSDDPYYMCFWVIITLDRLGKKNGTYFNDSRKLLFVILLLSDDQTFNSVIKSIELGASKQEKEILHESYKDGVTQITRFNSILITLEKKGLITLRKSRTLDTLDLTLNKINIPKDFFKNKEFNTEYKKITKLKSSVERMTALSLDTFIERVYKNNGVKTWQA
ncbi:hypothetical protein [Vibrio atypicus]|uniref:hypothetical protein n=1 Tax=Vibrio atypicus TaxID=558271 RepID=UPI00373593EA